MTDKPECSVIRIGRGQHPVALVDNFFSEAIRLRQDAQCATFSPALNLYPGIRAPLPDYYWSAHQMAFLEALIGQVFGLTGKITLVDASFSMVTTARAHLKVGQRMPHPDAFQRNHIALVHYLSDHITDGTAFYRHRATGLEVLSDDVRHAYFRYLDDEIQRLGVPPPDYINGDTAMFERIAEIAATSNRAILYSGRQLHSGAISAENPLSANPSQGRLTVTAFMTIG